MAGLLVTMLLCYNPLQAIKKVLKVFDSKSVNINWISYANKHWLT